MVRNACQDSTYTDPDFFLVHQYVIPSSTYSARKCGKENSEIWTGIVQVNFNSEAEYSRKASYGAIGSFNSLEKILKEYWSESSNSLKITFPPKTTLLTPSSPCQTSALCYLSLVHFTTLTLIFSLTLKAKRPHVLKEAFQHSWLQRRRCQLFQHWQNLPLKERKEERVSSHKPSQDSTEEGNFNRRTNISK